MKHVLWTPHVTICFNWILPAFHLNYKTTQLLKILKLNLFLILKTYFNWILTVSHLKTHPALNLNLFLNLKDNWTMPTFHQEIFSVSTMTDRIPSTTPGEEPPRDARDSGSARLHSMHLETSSSDRP